MLEPGDPDINSYGVDYQPGADARARDLGIRDSDLYVAERDPLRAVVTAPGGEADVHLGVDPGTFFCGDQLANLLDLQKEAPFAGATRVGFIHVPPDRATGPGAATARALCDRATNLEHIARVLAVALRALAAGPGDAKVGVTGFGPFQGVPENPTAAFVGEPAHLGRAMSLAFPGARLEGSVASAGAPAGARHLFRLPGDRRVLLAAIVLPLAPSREDALAGRYVSTEVTGANFGRWAAGLVTGQPPAGVVSFGVDSGQVFAGTRPCFKVETQTRGWHRGPERGRSATEGFRRDLALAQIFMDARRRGDPLLSYRR